MLNKNIIKTGLLNKQNLLFCMLALGVLFTARVYSAVPTVADYTAVPPVLSDNASPLVMLALSNDHQLYYKAFTDYDDMTGNGLPDTSYTNDIKYVGYFDNTKCYIYNTQEKVYLPSSLMDDPSTGAVENYCNQSVGVNNEWSGNFLNWGTMTRMDQVRKVLYGGFRSDDPSDRLEKTILERSYIPTDAHSFAKYYNGSDIARLTPFDGNLSDPDVADRGITMCNTTIESAGDSTYAYTGSGSSSTTSSSSSTSTSTTSSGGSCGTYCNWNGTAYPLCVLPYHNQWYWGWESGVQCIGTNSCEYDMSNAGGIVVNPCSSSSSSSSSSTSSSTSSSSSSGAASTTSTFTRAGNNFTTHPKPPLVRVVEGDFSLWAASERWQCAYQGEKSVAYGTTVVAGVQAPGQNGNIPAKTRINSRAYSPRKFFGTTEHNTAKHQDGTLVGDYVVRVEVCNGSLLGTETCKPYPDGNLKPIGILQTFGDDEQVQFGMISGSYEKNKSGGVLRKDISPLDDEVNVSSDGTFSGASGIIRSVNLFRIARYDAADTAGLYHSKDGCYYHTNSYSEGDCSNWGNPFAEILLECYRYYAGQTTGNFLANDSSYIPGLTRDDSWNVPLDSTNYCAELNVIGFNASSTSYDSGNLGGFSDLLVAARSDGKSTASSITDLIGTGEGFSGKKFFVGENGVDRNQLCTAKTITKFGDVRGTCPDSPRLSGSYNAAGLAYHARTHDLRPDANATIGLPEKQTVKTYGVTLSPGVPNIEIPVPGKASTVKILPACRAKMTAAKYSWRPYGNCGLVDFKIVKNYEKVSNGVYEGLFYVNWEDTEHGGDYDMDLYGMISYTITGTDITVTTDIVAESTNQPMGFGFVISGTTDDGFHVWDGIESFSEYTSCTGCTTSSGATTKTFSLGTTAAGLLKQPLYYAAKWGGFSDTDNSDSPLVLTDANDNSEWDSKNNTTGAWGADGIPDTYFEATNPNQLQSQLGAILSAILERTASGTSAAVVTNSGSGEGALYQALYNPRYTGTDPTEYVGWVGTLNALFLDSYGNLREDSSSPFGQLTDSDNIVNVYYSATAKKTLVKRFLFGVDGAVGAEIGNPVDVRDIKPIWSAGEKLSEISDFKTQRTYASTADQGRYIFTGVDGYSSGVATARDGKITEDEVVPFTETQFDSSVSVGNAELYRLLGLVSTNATDSTDIVNYVRGERISGYRNRRLNIDSDPDVEALLLGDITHSSPHSVGRPAEGYDLNYGDETYRAFRNHYHDRRQVVYIGANDGMLHAFNAGFFNSLTSTYELTPSSSAKTQHPLGSEIWAYVPYNLLPHLKWLTAPDYPHVYYVDGSIKHYDVNIFTPDTDHPGGWGTILVVGMRFGGGAYTFDPDEDDDSNSSENITLRSSYIVLDVTNPEVPPKVLAEISTDDLGYTTSEPTLVRMRESSASGSYSNPALNEWHLVFGTGPTGHYALSNAVSNQTSKIYAYDLNAGALNTWSTGDASSFIGGAESVDWSRDYKDDAIYYGTVAGSAAAPSGSLKRIALDYSGGVTASTSTVLAVNQPFVGTPLAVKDSESNFWVYAGTGRFFVSGDNYSTATQSFYGIKEPKTSSGTITSQTLSAATDLVNTTGITVYTDGTITKPSPTDAKLASATTFDDVSDAAQAVNGWYFNFVRPMSRNFTGSVSSDQSLVFTEYQPSGLKCKPEGNGYLNAVHLQAGIPAPFAALGSTPGASGTPDVVNMSVDLGLGSPSSASIFQTGTGKKFAIVQSSTGALSSTEVYRSIEKGARQSWRELIIDWQ